MAYWDQLGFQKLLWKTNILAFQKKIAADIQ